MQSEDRYSASRPRLNGFFNLLIGIFLLLAAYGVLLFFVSSYTADVSCITSGGCALGFGTSPDVLAPLYIWLGAGVILVIYSFKLILFGVLSFAGPEQKPFSELQSAGKHGEKSGAQTAEQAPPPPPRPEPALASTAKCEFCGTELPSDATYCPTCFQKRRIGMQERTGS